MGSPERSSLVNDLVFLLIGIFNSCSINVLLAEPFILESLIATWTCL